MSDRKNIPTDSEVFERLAAQKGEDDTWTDVMRRAAEALEDDESGATAAEDGCTQTARIPTEQAEEIARMAGDQAARELQNQLTGP